MTDLPPYDLSDPARVIRDADDRMMALMAEAAGVCGAHVADDDRTPLRARLVAAGYITDGTHYELFQPGSGATIMVALFTDGSARVSAFDGQMSWKWSADFTTNVGDALILNFLDAAEAMG